jgi:hypothetical protein
MGARHLEVPVIRNGVSPQNRLPTIISLLALVLSVGVATLSGASGCDGGVLRDLPGDGTVDPDATVDDDGDTVDGTPEPDAQPDPCDGIDCGPNGVCAVAGQSPVCECDPGYHPDGLTCVEDDPVDPCEGITCGTNAHCEDGLCVCDTGYEGDPETACDPIMTQEQQVRQELVDIAAAEVGFCEGVDDRPYMQWQPGLWCYDFVSWVYSECSYSLPSPLSLPQYDTDNLPQGWRPEPGDLIKFNIQHYGMVAEVSPDGQTVYTIEGNVNSCVMERSTSDSAVEYYGSLDSVF